MKAVDFPPPRQRGIPIHLGLIAALAAIAAWAAWSATNEPIGLRFTIYIIVAAAAFGPLPVLGYRLWALLRARYQLDRDSLTITWGFRVERIPISDLEWVRPLTALAAPLRLPAFHLPGSLLGSRRTPNLGVVEFLASERAQLLLVATREHIYAISPSDPQAFLLNIQRSIEMGSLSPAEPQSVHPVFIIAEAWRSRLVRYLWMAGLFLNAGLLAWVSLMIPSLKGISLGFLPSGATSPAVPAVGLILLPIISIFMFALGWLAGLVFYRRPDQRALAYIIWTSGLLASILFLVGVLFIVITPA